MKNNKVIQFKCSPGYTKEGKRVDTMLKARTTADAVKEDANLMRTISHAEYLNDDVGLVLDNDGGLIQMLREAKKIEDALGFTDPYATEDEYE